MDLKEQILTEHSKWNAVYIANEVGSDPDQFIELWNYTKSELPHLSSRAAWSFEIVCLRYPDLLNQVLLEIIEMLPTIEDVTIKRHMLKILSFADLPEDQLGVLFNTCLNWIEAPGETVAIKAHSLQILFNISEVETDLKPELIVIIETNNEKNSSGFKARGNMLLKKLYKEIN